MAQYYRSTMAGKQLILYLLLSVAMFFTHAMAVNPPAIFIFGDSTMDVGTNSYLPLSRVKANFPFNGIDFPGHVPTGRFSNGYNTADFIAQRFGFEMSPPPFLALQNESIEQQILKGVNFASGGSGILNQTGLIWVEVVPLKKQAQEQFVAVYNNLTTLLGSSATADLLSKSLFVISVGGNDLFEYKYINNTQEGLDQFIQHLMAEYEANLRLLYRLGAKKFGIISVAPIGCCPTERSHNKNYTCTPELNLYARRFYYILAKHLHRLSLEMKDMKYSLGNTYKMVKDILHSSKQLKHKKVACCGGGKLNGVDDCTPKANLCDRRDTHLFWDKVHPTSAASDLAAWALYNQTIEYASPINFKQLVEEN